MLQLRLAGFEKRTRGRGRQTTRKVKKKKKKKREKKEKKTGGGGGGGRYTYLDVYYITT